MAKKQKKTKKTKKKQKVSISSLLFAILFGVGAVMLMPTTMVLVVGMVPTAVAIFSDTTEERTAGMTIGAMNLAGVLPAVFKLWSSAHTVKMSLSIISDPFMLLYMYGGAGVGAFIYVNVPPIVSVFLKGQAKRRIKAIKEQQNEMLERWGAKVSDSVVKEKKSAARS